jgi:hypothetical protein
MGLSCRLNGVGASSRDHLVSTHAPRVRPDQPTTPFLGDRGAREVPPLRRQSADPSIFMKKRASNWSHSKRIISFGHDLIDEVWEFYLHVLLSVVISN